ncbi:MAG TPA: hypothetical protein VFG30_43795 [Polyangiales bacterium]|nr:hypothetical protein [Polyangiales bacterium]
MDVMSLEAWRRATKHWSQPLHRSSVSLFSRQAPAVQLRDIDTALEAYQVIAKHEIEARITSLTALMNVTEHYIANKVVASGTGVRAERQEEKVAAARELNVQTTAKRKYLRRLLDIERDVPAFFGQAGGVAAGAAPGQRFREFVRSVMNAKDYIGSESGGLRRLHHDYWTEGIDPLHRNWGDPRNSLVFQAWMNARWGAPPTTQLSFFRWLETLTPAYIEQQTQRLGLLATDYQNVIGRAEFKIDVRNGQLAYLDSLTSWRPWSSTHYRSNFGGDGWCIFVMDNARHLYANSHDQSAGWFHSAFLGGQPVLAAGELWARGGKLYVITDKSGHYKPGSTHMLNFVRALFNRGLDLSATQLWVRHTNGGISPWCGGIWYEAIDVAAYMLSNDVTNSKLYNFGYGGGGVRFTRRDNQDVRIESSFGDLADKNRFRKCSAG